MTGGWTFLDHNSNSSVQGCMGVYRRILCPLRRCSVAGASLFSALVLSKLQTGWVWKLLELATTVRKWIEIDIPAIVCSKLRQTMGRRKRNRKRFCVDGGIPHSSPRDDEPPALLSLACMFGEALKTNEKESYMTKKFDISDVRIPPPPPPPHLKKS